MKVVLRRILMSLMILWSVMLVVSFVLSPKSEDLVIDLLKKYLDKHLKTEIRVMRNDIKISLFKTFPNSSLEVNNLCVISPIKHPQKTDYDTLLFARKSAIHISFKKLLQREIAVQKFIVDDARVNVYINKKGKVNYNIWEGAANDSVSKNDSLAFNINELELRSVQLNYLDAQKNIYNKQYIKNAKLKGTFNKEKSTIRFETTAHNKLFKSKNRTYFDNQTYAIKTQLQKSKGTLLIPQGSISLQGFPLLFHGSVSLIEKENQSRVSGFHFNLTSNNVKLEKLKSKEFEGILKKYNIVAKRGLVALHAEVKKQNINSKAKFTSSFSIQNLKAEYRKEKPLDFEAVLLRGKYWNVSNGGGLVLDTLIAKTERSNATGWAKIQNLNNPIVKTNLEGSINGNLLAKLSGNTNYKGNVAYNLNYDGLVPRNKKQLREAFISGDYNVQLQTQDLTVSNLTKEELLLSGNANINSDVVKFDTLSVNSLNNVFKANGELIKVSGLLASVPSISVNATIKGNTINLNHLLYETESDTSKSANLQYLLKLNITTDKFQYSHFKSEKSAAYVLLNNNKLLVQKADLKCYGGKVKGNLQYLFTENSCLSGNAQAYGIEIQPLFMAFNNFGQQEITHENLKGKLTSDTEFYMCFDTASDVDLSTLKITSAVEIGKGALLDFEPMYELSRYAGINELQNIRFDRFSTNITIANEALNLDKTRIKTSLSYIEGYGTHKFDNSYTYYLDVSIDDYLVRKSSKRKKIQNEFGYIVDDGKKTMLPLKLTENGVSFNSKKALNRFRLKEYAEEKTEDDPKQSVQMAFEGDTVSASSTIKKTEHKADTITFVESETKKKNKKQTKKERQEQEKMIIEWED